MNNKRVVVNSRSYFFDMDAFTVGVSVEFDNANKSGDQELMFRVMHSFLVRSMGLNQFLLIPMYDMILVCTAVASLLAEIINGAADAKSN